MKRINFFKSTAVLFAALLMAACGKDGNGGGNGSGNGNGNGGGNGDDPDPEPPVVVTSAIKIDGDFSDWEALTAAQAPTATYVDYEDPNVRTQAKLFRGYVDENYVFLYVEFSDTPDPIFRLQVHVDADNSTSTGTTTEDGSWYFADAGVEYLTEGEIFANGAYVSYDPGLLWWAEGDTYFATEAVGHNLGVGKSSTPVALANGNKAIEIQLLKEMFPARAVWGDKTGLGVGVVNESWDEVGRIPNNADASAAPMLVVPLTKSEE